MRVPDRASGRLILPVQTPRARWAYQAVALPWFNGAHRRPHPSSLKQYRLSANAKDGIGGMHCQALPVEVVAQRTLDFGGPRDIKMALRASGHDRCRAVASCYGIGGAGRCRTRIEPERHLEHGAQAFAFAFAF